MNIEPLESRIAPAVLVNPQTITYTDIDGDKVTVTTSAGAFVFTDPPNGDDEDDTFVFTTANAIGGQQLLVVDLDEGGPFQGADLIFSVVKAGAGDGLAAVGLILASGIDLGRVTVRGDLGQIVVGDADSSTPALELLSVRSMGRYGDVTDELVPGLVSDIRGALGALRVTEDIKDASINVTATVRADAKIGSVTIGGSLIGGAADNSGEIFAGGEIGPVKIGGSLIGGDGISSGVISADKLGTVVIGGSLVGGSGLQSGRIGVAGPIGAVKIGANVVGGTGTDSAAIFSDTRIDALTIGGSLLGGAGVSSGSVATSGDIGPVKIAHDVKGGSGNESGKIDAAGKLGTLTIGGSLLGGSGDQDTFTHHGQIVAAGDIGAITIGHDVKGGSGDASGKIEAGGKVVALTVGGSLLGGAGFGAGGIFTTGGIGPVKIGHDIVGGTGPSTGRILTNGLLGPTTVGGSLLGGAGSNSGLIFGDDDMGAVKIGHDVIGGAGGGSGLISGGARIAGVTIGGSLVGGSQNITGGITSVTLGPVRIGHDLVGASITGATPNLEESGFIKTAGRIDSVFIGGSIIAGIDNSTAGDLLFNASIRTDFDLGSLTVKGGLIGNVGPQGSSLVIISAGRQTTPSATTDVAIGKITIGGRAEFARIFAGYDTTLDPFNADAQIGSVSVGGDWVASSIVAGAINPGADPGSADDNINFGNFLDAKIGELGESATISSRISRITIAGQAFGTPVSFSDDDRFGFVAEEIGALKVGGATIALDAGKGNDAVPLGFSTSAIGSTIAAHEIGKLFGSTVLPVPAAERVNASTLKYTDADGDHVTVKLSLPLLTSDTIANSVFVFDTGNVGGPDVSGGQQLQLIDLTSLAATGLGVTVTVVPGGGDRLANVGAILADEDLGTITIPGDLGKINAGEAGGAPRALAALNVRTLGRLGLDTQPAASATFVPFVGGDILGGLGALAVKQDMAGSSLGISGALGSVSIGGSLIGGPGAPGDIFAQSIGAVKIGHHIQAVAAGFAVIDADTSIASVRIGGSVIAGKVNADGATLGPVSVAHNVLGGLADFSGRLSGNTGVANVTIGGSLLGGVGNSSGQIFSDSGGIGAVKIGHNVTGGAGNESGKIDSDAKLASLSIGGSLIGSSGSQSIGAHDGQIFAVTGIGPVTIGHDVLGGVAGFSASIRSTTGSLGSVTIGGSLVGGTTSDSGSIASGLDIGAVKIGHDVLGGVESLAGAVRANRHLGSVTIGGSLVGGSDGGNGVVSGHDSIGAVKIGHDVLGGSGPTSGYIVSDGKVTSVTIGGSLVGGTADRTGGIFPVELGPVKIGRDLIGGSIAGATGTLERSGFIESFSRIASVSIGGSIIAGIDDSTGGALLTNASIRAANDLGSLSVKGSLIGNAAPNGTSLVIISAGGQPAPIGDKNLVIASIVIGGRVERANILGGFGTNLVPATTFAQIGSVSVGRDWIASNLVAGVQNFGADGDPGGTGPAADNVNFGDAADTSFAAPAGNRIASIIIRGTIVGTAGGADHFGFSTGQIGVFKSLNFTAALTPGASADRIELSPITGDATLREL